MKNLFKNLTEYKAQIGLLIMILMVQAYCDLKMPEYVQRIIDEGLADAVDMEFLISCGLRMMVLVGVMFIASSIVSYIASRIGAGIGRKLRAGTYRRVMEYSEQEMDRFSTASLITRSTNDIQQIQLVTTMMLRMLSYAPVIGVYGVIKVWTTGTGMEWLIFLALLVVAGLVMLLMSLTVPKFKKMQPLVDSLNKVSREILTGLPVIRAFGTEKLEEKRFDKANRDLTENQLFTSRIMSMMHPTMMLLMNAMVAFITWTAAHKIDMGEMKVGQMTAFITYSITIVLSFLFMSMLSIMIPRAGAAADRIAEILETEPTIRDPESAVSAPGKESSADKEKQKQEPAEVVFDHVSFRYPGADEDVLSDIDFTAEKGKTTAIIGSTGSGKTTLINLIPRFYDVTSGSVRIDGKDVRDMRLSDLRNLIGFVPQKGVLFTGTIESNIGFAGDHITPEEVREAAEIAQASEFIDEKEDGFSSYIAQGGSNVSGGQKQRLQIARAIAKKPALLIFDDSFSALDMKTDAKLRHELEEKLSGVTRIIVAQRISTVLSADQILVMDEGKIVGRGTHAELLKSCEIYREIASSQLSERELARSEVSHG